MLGFVVHIPDQACIAGCKVTAWSCSMFLPVAFRGEGKQYRVQLSVKKRLLLQSRGCLADCAGVGNRGSSAVGRLIHNGKVSGAEMWCLDHDRKVLEQAGTANTVIVRKEEPHMVRSAFWLRPGGGKVECG